MHEVTPKSFYRIPTLTIENTWHAVTFKNQYYEIPISSKPAPVSKFYNMFKWCEENCTGRWSYTEITNIKFLFKTRRDFILFALTWSD